MIKHTIYTNIISKLSTVKILSKIIDTKPDQKSQNAVCHKSFNADRDQVQNIIFYGSYLKRF